MYLKVKTDFSFSSLELCNNNINNNIVKNYQVEFSCGSAVTVYLHGITNLFYCNVHEGVNKGSDKTINKTSRSVGDIPDTQTKGLLLKIRVKINRT